jgi:hypothetical protein
MNRSTTSTLFWIAGVYDFVIGIAFLIAGKQIFDWAGVNHPNHWAYIQFCSLLLMVFGAMFVTIARSPINNRNLIPFGILLKISYISIVGYYWGTTGCPNLFKPFAVIDLVMLVLFVVAYSTTAKACETKLLHKP